MVDPNELVELMEGHLSWVGAADSESGGSSSLPSDAYSSPSASLAKRGSFLDSFRSKDASSRKRGSNELPGSGGRNLVGGVLQHDPTTMSRPSHSIITPGDRVKIVKKGSQIDKCATIADGNWGGRVKVVMDSNGSTKSYLPSELKLVTPASRTGFFARENTSALYYNEEEEEEKDTDSASSASSLGQLHSRRVSMPAMPSVLAPLSPLSPLTQGRVTQAKAEEEARIVEQMRVSLAGEEAVPLSGTPVQRRQKRRKSLVPIMADGSTEFTTSLAITNLRESSYILVYFNGRDSFKSEAARNELLNAIKFGVGIVLLLEKESQYGGKATLKDFT